MHHLQGTLDDHIKNFIKCSTGYIINSPVIMNGMSLAKHAIEETQENARDTQRLET